MWSDEGLTCAGGDGQWTAGKTVHPPEEGRMLKTFWRSTWGSPEAAQFWSPPIHTETAKIETA